MGGFGHRDKELVQAAVPGEVSKQDPVGSCQIVATLDGVGLIASGAESEDEPSRGKAHGQDLHWHDRSGAEHHAASAVAGHNRSGQVEGVEGADSAAAGQDREGVAEGWDETAGPSAGGRRFAGQ